MRYIINIAKETTNADVYGNTYGKRYQHYAKVELSEDFDSVAMAKFAEFKRLFPQPEFKLELTREEKYYYTIEEV